MNAEERMIELTEERNGLVDTVAQLSRQVRSLKAELSRQHKDDPKMADAQEVFDRWVQTLSKNKRTAFDDARKKLVLARLAEPALTENGSRKADLFRAIQGMWLLPFVGPHGRQAEKGPGAKRHDSLNLLCREADTIERFIGYVDEHDAKQAQTKDKAREILVRHRGEDFDRPGQPRNHAGTLEGLIYALELKGCKVNWSSAQGRGSAQCPAHDDRSPSLSMKECSDGKVLIHCFAGCETRSVLDALGTTWGALGSVGTEAYRAPAPAQQELAA